LRFLGVATLVLSEADDADGDDDEDVVVVVVVSARHSDSGDAAVARDAVRTSTEPTCASRISCQKADIL